MQGEDNGKLESSSSPKMTTPLSRGSDGREKALEFLKLGDPKKRGAVAARHNRGRVSQGRVSRARGVDQVYLNDKQRRKLAGKPGNVKETGRNEIAEILKVDEASQQERIDDALKLREEELLRSKFKEEKKEGRDKQELKIWEAGKEPDTQESKTSSEFETQAQIQEELEHIFGYRSKLNYPNQFSFKEDKAPAALESSGSETELIDLDEEKDMTWLLEISSIDEKRRNISIRQGHHVEIQTQDLAQKYSWLFWYFLWIGGRMPFCFGKNYNPEKLQTTCVMKKKSCRFYAFVITSIFIIFVTVVSIINFALMITEEDVNGYFQTEKLLLAKNKVPAVVFITSLVFASILSIHVLIYGDSMAKYITLWGKTLDEFHFDPTSGVMTVIIIYIIWNISLLLLHLFVFLRTNSDPNSKSLVEAIHLLTAIVFRSLVPKVLVRPDSDAEIQIADNLWKYGVFVICLNAYAIYCFLNFVLIVVIFAIGIRNMAYEWNFRLRVALRQVNTKRSEIFLRSVKHSIGYQQMFDCHRKIVFLVQNNRSLFCTILVAFYLAVALALGAEFFEIAIFAVGREEHTFSPNDNLTNLTELYNVEKTPDRLMYLCFNLFQTLVMFLFVSLCLAQTSSEVMSGEVHINRHGFMNITSIERKSFYMSLLMSFNPRKKHLLGAGRIFSIDRPFIFGFLGFFMYLFTIMILTQRPSTATIPTIIECGPASCGYCSAFKDTTISQIPGITYENAERAVDYLHRARCSQNQTISPTTNSSSPTTNSPSLTQDICEIMDIPNVQLPRACILNSSSPMPIQVEPFPDNCRRRKISGKIKPFAFLDSSSQIVDCTNPSNRITDQRRDDCLNVPLFHETLKVPSVQRVAKVRSEGVDYVMCCYDYGFSEDQLRSCNQRTNESLRDLCEINHDPKSFAHPFRYDVIPTRFQACLNNFISVGPLCDELAKCLCSLNPTYAIINSTILGVQTSALDCP